MPERRATALLEALPDAVVVIDGTGTIVHVNAVTECLFGHSREQLVGRGHGTILSEAFGEHLGRTVAAHDGSTAVHQAGAASDVRGRRHDGSEFPVEVNYTIGRLDDELEVVASIRDVTERRRAEAELRTALSLVSATLESTADGILVVAADGRITGVNERFQELWQIPAELIASRDDEQLLGYVLEQLVDAPAFIAKVHDLYEHPEAESNDVLRFHDDRIFERYSRPQRVGDEIVGRVWSFRDVTSRQRAQDQARQALADLSSADARFRALVESSDDPILSTTPEGRVTSWNAAAERLFDYSREEILDQPFARLVPGSGHEALEVHRLATEGGSGRRTIEVELARKDGVLVPVSLTVSPIYDGERITGVSAIIRDITASRDRERELLEAKAAAVEASQAKSEFLATMSHEIRTPMNGVIGLTGLLLSTELNDVQQRYAAGVRGAGEALLAIVDDILDFSKLEAGKVALESVDFSPRQLVEELGVLLAETAVSHGLDFRVRADETVPTAVTGDPRRLRQALINLTGNAIKFTPRGEVEVTVSTVGPRSTRVGEPATLRFTVRDTGIGIEPDVLGRLFEPFSQADASTTRRFGGTGLGLAITSRLVQALSGDIDVITEPGTGSTFAVTVTLPVAAPVSASSPDLGLAPLSAIVVDDDETNRQILQAHLESMGLRAVQTVPDADAALALLHGAAASGRPYDLAILDLLMPGTDGLALAEAIADDPSLHATRALILTSGGDLDVGRARAAGVSDCLGEPVRPDDLVEALLRVVSADDHAADEATHAALSSARAGAGNGRILVAEDNPVNQMVALGFLEELGYEAILAGDGRQALAALEHGGFDAVLMDCHMPEMDGFQATRELRASEDGGRRTPVIAMTAGVLDEDRERCLAAGMDDFVAKPIEVEHLRRTLARWVAADAREAGPEPVLDLARLETLRRVGKDDGWGVLPGVARLFVDGADDLVERLRRAAATGNLEATGVAAHTIKGTAANVGAGRLVAACVRVEQAVDRGACPAQNLLGAVERELRAAVADLRELIAPAP